MKKYFKILDKKASLKKQFWYKDPISECRVLTTYFLLKREYCCRSNCRHCPYGYDEDLGCHVMQGIPIKKRIQSIYHTNNKEEEVVILPTKTEDLILKKRTDNTAQFYNLIGKLVKFYGYKEREKFFVKKWELINENETS